MTYRQGINKQLRPSDYDTHRTNRPTQPHNHSNSTQHLYKEQKITYIILAGDGEEVFGFLALNGEMVNNLSGVPPTPWSPFFPLPS